MPLAQVYVMPAAAPDAAAIELAGAVIRAGGLVAFPTETVYGLGANALDETAVEAIFRAKRRPADDPLIVHVAGVEDLAGVALHVPDRARELASRFWPGPLTLVLPRGPSVPMNVTAGAETVAVRAPSHPIARALIEAARRPIAAPSANLFSRPSPTTAAHVLDDLGESIDLVIDGGPTPLGVESTVLDLTGDRPRILRHGGVTAEVLRRVVGELDAATPRTQHVASPGTALRHYSPRARVDLFDGDEGLVIAAMARHLKSLVARHERLAVLAFDDDLTRLALDERVPRATLGSRDDLAGAAARLYAALRALDSLELDAIVTRLPPAVGLGMAIRDRLTRAANGLVRQIVDDSSAD